jgi:hypothetical protein
MRSLPIHTTAGRAARRLLTGLSLAACSMAAGALGAQSPVPPPALPRVALAGHLGTAYPVGAFGEVATSGLRTGASVTVRVAPRVGLYAGYASAGLLARSDEAELADGGPLGGVAVALPLAFRGTAPVARVGAVYNRVRADAPVPAAGAGGTRTLGVEAQLGWPVRVGRRLALVPALRGQSYQPRGNGRRSLLGAEVGVQVALGGA